MGYDKGKISATGREISWLNHPCYLGYKGEVGYKVTLNFRSSRRPYIYANDKFVRFLREAKKLNEI